MVPWRGRAPTAHRGHDVAVNFSQSSPQAASHPCCSYMSSCVTSQIIYVRTIPGLRVCFRETQMTTASGTVFHFVPVPISVRNRESQHPPPTCPLQGNFSAETGLLTQVLKSPSSFYTITHAFIYAFICQGLLRVNMTRPWVIGSVCRGKSETSAHPHTQEAVNLKGRGDQEAKQQRKFV